jgi:hypothetical protein
MDIILLNGKTITITSKEELYKHFDNCRYPASDAVNARSEGIISREEYYETLRSIFKRGDRNDD